MNKLVGSFRSAAPCSSALVILSAWIYPHLVRYNPLLEVPSCHPRVLLMERHVVVGSGGVVARAVLAPQLTCSSAPMPGATAPPLLACSSCTLAQVRPVQNSPGIHSPCA